MYANFRNINIWKGLFNSFLKLHQPCESVKQLPRYGQYSKITGFSFWPRIGYRRTHFNMCSEIQQSVLKQWSPSLKTQCTCFKSCVFLFIFCIGFWEEILLKEYKPNRVFFFSIVRIDDFVGVHCLFLGILIYFHSSLISLRILIYDR